MFDTGLYLPKLSLVLSYEKIVPRTSPRLRLYLRCIATYVGLGAITATAADAFWCGSDPSINWQVTLNFDHLSSSRELFLAEVVF